MDYFEFHREFHHEYFQETLVPNVLAETIHSALLTLTSKQKNYLLEFHLGILLYHNDCPETNNCELSHNFEKILLLEISPVIHS